MFDVDEWLDSLKDKLPEGDLEAARKELKSGFLRQDDYSRKMDANRETLTKQQKELDAHQNRLDAWYAENEKRLAMAASFESQYGSIEDFEKVAGGYVSPSGEQFSNAEVAQLKQELGSLKKAYEVQARNVQAALNQVQGQSINLTKFAVSKAMKHQKDFKEDFDIDAFDGFVAEKMASNHSFRDLNDAYEAFVAPKRVEKEKQDREEWEKQRIKELRMEVMSRDAVPNDGAGTGGSPLFDALTKQREAEQVATHGKSDSELSDRFARAFYEAAEH
jgi:post-segregation antitoxin (ccd killing protein)